MIRNYVVITVLIIVAECGILKGGGFFLVERIAVFSQAKFVLRFLSHVALPASKIVQVDDHDDGDQKAETD